MDRTLPMRRLQSILSRYGVGWEVSRGKGSHIMFYRDFNEGRFTYPDPSHKKDVLIC
jgi:predicted RNA binding protein YcfA (HicA-like mRNA interferase family)